VSSQACTKRISNVEKEKKFESESEKKEKGRRARSINAQKVQSNRKERAHSSGGQSVGRRRCRSKVRQLSKIQVVKSHPNITLRSPRKTHLAPQLLRRAPPRHGALFDALALNRTGPVLPITRHLREHVAHDLGAGHEAVLLALEDADFAFAHQFAEPADVGNGDARVFAAVVDDDGAVDVFIAEADGLFGFEADD